VVLAVVSPAVVTAGSSAPPQAASAAPTMVRTKRRHSALFKYFMINSPFKTAHAVVEIQTRLPFYYTRKYFFCQVALRIFCKTLFTNAEVRHLLRNSY
jgi:hypothetical protein